VSRPAPIRARRFSTTRSADSRVGILDGKTIVIGGLMEDRKTQTLRKGADLGDIPGLGLLFRA